MQSLINRYIKLFLCPKDRGQLRSTNHHSVLCDICRSSYPILAENFIDLRPPVVMASPQRFQNRFEEHYFQTYTRLRNEATEMKEDSIAWGASENLSKTELRRKLREVHQILSLLRPGGGVACDVSGGAGHLVLPMALQHELVVNSDLDIANLNYVRQRAQERRLKNVLLVRADLFFSPFAPQSFDRVVCTDTLTYGDVIVRSLLKAIAQSMKVGGVGVIDLYNRRHRNPFHAPYLMGYTRKECETFLDQLDGFNFEYEGFYQELNGALRWLTPATRHIFILSRNRG